ncbi:MAG TPA: PAS domain S-box protein [Puia sp.]|nr:PAS domain S-box protein [Puia sp.]
MPELLASSHEILFALVDPFFRVLDANPCFRKSWMEEPKDTRVIHIQDLLLEEDLCLFEEIMADCLSAPGKVFTVDLRVKKTGAEKYFRLECSAEPASAEGSSVSLMGREITGDGRFLSRPAANVGFMGADAVNAMHLAGNLLKTRQEFHSFMENTPALTWIIDESGIVHYMNPPYLAAYQLKEDIIGQNIFQQFPPDLVETYIRNNRLMLEAGRAIDTIEEGRKPDGSRVIYHVIKFPLGIQNGKQLIGGTAIDITEQVMTRRELEAVNERYHYANQATSDVIWDIDLRSQEVFCTEGYTDMFGYANITEPLSQGIVPAHPDDQAELTHRLQDALEGTTDRWQQEYRALCADGGCKTVINKAFILRDEQGRAIRMIGAVQDVSERRRLENRLLEEEKNRKQEIVQAILDAQEKERKEIAFELQDNVSQMLASAKLLLEIAAAEPAEAGLSIAGCYGYLQQAIGEIRNMARDLTPYALKDLGLVMAIQDYIDKVNGTKNIWINFEPKQVVDEQRLPWEIRLSLFRIIQDKISNILQHSGADLAWVELAVEESSIHLSISDNGKGFNQDEIKKGIGLNRVYNSVAFYQGQIKLKTAPGEGCRLDVTLPVKAV